MTTGGGFGPCFFCSKPQKMGLNGVSFRLEFVSTTLRKKSYEGEISSR